MDKLTQVDRGRWCYNKRHRRQTVLHNDRYNNEHFEDGEVYLQGLTDPTT